MATVMDFKEQSITETPLFLFDCALPSGEVEHWSTHAVTVGGVNYEARVVKHNLLDLKASSDYGADTSATVSATFANADSFGSEIEWNAGWKGAQLSAQFVFYDLVGGAAASDTRIVFRGIANAPDEITESTVRVTFTNRLNLQRVSLPELRIQRLCPWSFPSTSDQRIEAVDGGTEGAYSRYYRCGYSYGASNGAGNAQADSTPYTTCDYSRASCTARGMFDQDSANNVTRRFGGMEFVPAAILVRSYGASVSQISPVLDNTAQYNDPAPLVYGTGWYEPPIVVARNDGNLTRMEVLLGGGEMTDVVTVVVNDIEIPQAVSGANMTATGWFNVVTFGTRNGAFDTNFTDGSGNPLGDPYGSLAMMSVVVPNRISNGQSLPRIQALVQGMKLPQYASDGSALPAAFSNNPAWVLLDLLRRSGWTLNEIDLASFAATAQYCDQPVSTTDTNGNPASLPRYQCNLVLQKRRSAADVVRGVRNGSALLLTYSSSGLIQLRAEASLAVQQPAKPETSNSTETLNGGWPAYEFSDGSAAFSGILRKANGEPYLRLYGKSSADSPNRYSVEFQDEFNDYQQDSLSLVDVDDADLISQEISATLTALGLPNFDQSSRMLQLQLSKSLEGNLYVEFATSVRGFGLMPGDLITITYAKEGMTRQPFRIVKIAPTTNYATVVITAQYHDDAWYGGAGTGQQGRRQSAFGVGIPRPLLGTHLDANGEPQFDVTETVNETSDGTVSVDLSIAFTAPSKPAATGIAIPLLSLTPALASTGGTLAANQTLYYAISALDQSGAESPLSFAVKATIPEGANTNTVTLASLSFSAPTASFNVYRGENPTQFVQIASQVAVADHFTDTGANPTTLVGPPDENYDHANFYWRFELQPEMVVDIHSPTTVGNSTLNMLGNENRGALVRITRGLGEGQEITIAANDATTLTLAAKWDVEPDSTSYFVIAESSWRFGALTVAGPAEFPVPNRKGMTVHILGRSANAGNQECAAELSPLTRWQIGGSGGADSDVPPAPLFGLAPVGRGSVDIVSVGFTDLTNTGTISSGTLIVQYWDELSGAPVSMSGAISDQDTALKLPSPGTAQPGDLIQIGAEIVQVTAVSSDNLQYTVIRASHQSTAAAHADQTPLYLLARKSFVIPFAPEFFGSPASGSYSHPIYLPGVRIAAADLFMTNDWGNGATSGESFTGTVDLGIRTLSGGQFALQLDGILAIESDAAALLTIEDVHAVHDIFAVVKEAPESGDIELSLKQNGAAYCDLTIPAGATASNVVNGFGLPPLEAKAQLTLDVVSVPQSPDTFPGSDLTVTLRL
jgi:Putative phage tail protein